MSNMTDPINIKQVSCAAIDPYLETHVVKPTETKIRGRNYVEWGESNKYPEYLLDLFNNCPTLRTIIIGTANYVCGDDISIDPRVKGIDEDSIHDLSLDDGMLGGFALQVVRDMDGNVAASHYIELRHLRSDEDNEEFRYSEKWNKGGRDAIVYPKFRVYAPGEWAKLTQEEKERNISSIYYDKPLHFNTYPAPRYAAAVKDCEIERGIADYHLNNLENGFTSSMLINFNNGVPADKIREQIEKDATEKFTGHQNAGRVMFSWNASRTNETTFSSPKVEDFTEKYDALSKHSRQMIYTAFQAIPALFGLMDETTGFSEQEFAEAFKLYNRTVVRPVQRRITRALERIWGGPVLTIKPFSLEAAAVQVNDNVE